MKARLVEMNCPEVLIPDAVWIREDQDGAVVHTLIVLDEIVHKTNTGLGFPLNWEVEI